MLFINKSLEKVCLLNIKKIRNKYSYNATFQNWIWD